jgi:hypothetical protein
MLHILNILNMFKYISFSLTCMFSYTKIFFWGITIYLSKKEKEKNQKIYQCLLKNILSSGSVPIKFIQWLIPFLYITMEPEYHYILEMFKETYENCLFHSMEETEKIYLELFKNDINDDYENIQEISSGSIGQVYKITDKNTKKDYALKVIHPFVRYELFIVKYFIYYLTKLFDINNIILFDLNLFLIDFEQQKDFINEGNNIMYFYHQYKDNHKIKIPQLNYLSNDLLIMEFLEGKKINDFKEHNQYKYSLLFLLFVNNNLQFLKLNHGDLHEGNYKINDDKLIIYDFGYCWENHLKNVGLFDISLSVFSPINIYICDDDKINILIDTMHMLNIPDEYDDFIKDEYKNGEITNGKEFVLFIIMIYKKKRILIDINNINLLLTYINLYLYGTNAYFIELFNYCKTNNIFPSYQIVLKEHLRVLDELNKKNENKIEDKFNHLKKYIV